MPSGQHLTQEQFDAIVLRIRQLKPDGRYRFNFKEIAAEFGIHRATVQRVCRRAASKWGEKFCWRADNPV